MPVRISVEIVQNTGTRKNAVTPRAMSASTFMQKADGQYDANSMLRSAQSTAAGRYRLQRICRGRPTESSAARIFGHRSPVHAYVTIGIINSIFVNIPLFRYTEYLAVTWHSKNSNRLAFFGFYFLDKTTVN